MVKLKKKELLKIPVELLELNNGNYKMKMVCFLFMILLPLLDQDMTKWLEFLKLEETPLKILMTPIIIILKLELSTTKTPLLIMILFKTLIICGVKNNLIFSLLPYNIKMNYSLATLLL
jgi:hypothetical protein